MIITKQNEHNKQKRTGGMIMIKSRIKVIIIAVIVFLAIIGVLLIWLSTHNNRNKFTDATWVFNQKMAYGTQEFN